MLLFCFADCNKTSSGNNDYPGPPANPPVVKSDVEFYLTTGNQASLLQKQTTPLVFTTASNGYADIIVDTTQTFQTVKG